MTEEFRLEKAREMEAQARALIAHANLSQKDLLAEASNYITCAKFLRKGWHGG